ncbi:MAG: restriction endonuclease subunit S [Desulfobacterales bacterium]|nr:restriction endonuclease subunit S [Desulfobacterales bacterium]
MKRKVYPKYKDSGVEWLGEVPGHWEVKRLKYQVTINDETLPETTSPDYELLYVDISSVDPTQGITKKEQMIFENAPSRARRTVKNGDTIVSTVRTYLSAISPVIEPENNLIVSTGFAVIRPRKICKDYLAAVIRAPYFIEEVVSRSVGVSYPAINASEIGLISIPLPPLQEQQAIAAYLDCETGRIDALIAKKQRLLELLAEQRTAIISRAVTKGLYGMVARSDAEFAEWGEKKVSYKSSGVEWLGDVPEHWVVKRLKFLLQESLQYGANESAELDDPDLPRFIRITDVNEHGSLREETFRSLPEDVAKSFLLQEGDLLFARSGATVGKTFFYQKTWGRAAYAGYLIRARLNKKAVIPNFVNLITKTGFYQQWIQSMLIQATIQNVSAEKYASFVIPLPPLPEQKTIAAYLDRETSKIDTLSAKIKTAIEKLKEYRTAIISAAVTGKIEPRKARKARKK